MGRLLLYDALQMRFRELKLRRNPECPFCGEQPTIRELIDYHEFCGVARGAGVEDQPAGADLTPPQLKAKMDRGDGFLLLDVREPNEVQICRLPGSVHIPMREVLKRLGELDRKKEIVVYCRSGARSGKVADLLRNHGFANVRNLTGGILARSDQVDPSVPKH